MEYYDFQMAYHKIRYTTVIDDRENKVYILHNDNCD